MFKSGLYFWNNWANCTVVLAKHEDGLMVLDVGFL